MVWNAMGVAIGFDYFLNLSKLVCGHRGEQVMFNLAAQAARAVINSRMVLNVPACQHLLAKEVCRRGAIQQRHALMIRREYQSQIEPQESLLREKKQNGVLPTQQVTKQTQKPKRVENEETHFNDRVCDLVTHQESNAVNFQHERLEQ